MPDIYQELVKSNESAIAEIMNRLSYFLATGFYSGLSPISPGTAGSAACVLLWLGANLITDWQIGALQSALLALLVTIIGIITSNHCIKNIQAKSPDPADPHFDPGFIVIDEWAGMLIALCGASSFHASDVIAAFVLFRLFDILKPPPVSTAEKLPGAWGVMLDDVVAGGIALGVMSLLHSFSLL